MQARLSKITLWFIRVDLLIMTTDAGNEMTSIRFRSSTQFCPEF